MNYDEVMERFKEINVTDLFGTRKEVEELPNVLRSDEKIMYATSGMLKGKTWLVTCTDKRVIFLDKGILFGLNQIDIPLEKINSISYRTGVMFGSIIIHHGSDSMEVKQINKETLSPMTEIINNEIEKTKRLHSNTNEVSSVADEISKFKNLLDAGAITEEEYEKKKKELLNL